MSITLHDGGEKVRKFIKDVPEANKPRKILAMLIHFGELKNGKTCKSYERYERLLNAGVDINDF